MAHNFACLPIDDGAFSRNYLITQHFSLIGRRPRTGHALRLAGADFVAIRLEFGAPQWSGAFPLAAAAATAKTTTSPPPSPELAAPLVGSGLALS